jgi:hypothetical protein
MESCVRPFFVIGEGLSDGLATSQCSKKTKDVYNPKGVAPVAQGWRFAYPGKLGRLIFNPVGVCGLFDRESRSVPNVSFIPFLIVSSK